MTGRDIPDLRTLLASRRGAESSRGRGRGRGRGPGAHPSGSPHIAHESLKDNAVRQTDQDAAGSRVSCVELGYLDDPYAKLFATQPSTRRLPLLNRGTYVRTSAIDRLVSRFVAAAPSSPKQIVSLGAGTDTRYFRLRDQHPDARIVYHEIDFPANTAAKLAAIQRHPELHSRLGPEASPGDLATTPAPTAFHSPSYNLHALDLRTLADHAHDPSPPALPNLDQSIPTLILSEMCLVYLQASAASSILMTFLQKYLPMPTPVSVVLYEPILPHDAFGRTMITNLASRNISLPTLTAYPELADERARLRSCGFGDGAKAADTGYIWRRWISEQEKERVADLEFLDEHEELDLLLGHYCVAWAWRDGGDEGVFTRAWADVSEPD